MLWLLLRLTAELPLVARAWDGDGEFMLIEAADALPRWLDRCEGYMWHQESFAYSVFSFRSMGLRWFKYPIPGCYLFDQKEEI